MENYRFEFRQEGQLKPFLVRSFDSLKDSEDFSMLVDMILPSLGELFGFKIEVFYFTTRLYGESK